MATMFYESNLETSGMFSMSSHQREKEKKKSDRKSGKERRKAEKTLQQNHPLSQRYADYNSASTIWCDYGSPILNDKESLIVQNSSTNSKPATVVPIANVEKPLAETISPNLQEIIDMQNAYFDHYSLMEYELDMLDLLEAQETEFQIRLQKMEKIWAEEEAVPDDYIAEIDDDYDF